MSTKQPFLAPEHKGTRINYSGMLQQARNELRRAPFAAEMLRQFTEHLTELGARFYAGDAAVVDEFLQLYCIGRDARAAAVAAVAAAPAQHLLPVYEVTLKSRAQLRRDIPRERWGWWGDVAGGQTLRVRDATAADLARCSLDAPRSQDPADYVCEAIHRGALVPREALAQVYPPTLGLFYDAAMAAAPAVAEKPNG